MKTFTAAISILLLCSAIALAEIEGTCNDGNMYPCDGCDNGKLLSGFICPEGDGKPCFRDGHAIATPVVFTEHFIPNATDTLELLMTTSGYDRKTIETEFILTPGSSSPITATWPSWVPVPLSCDKESRLHITLKNLIGHAGEKDLSDYNTFRYLFTIRTTVVEFVWIHSDESNETGVFDCRKIVSDFHFLLTIDRKVSVCSVIGTFSPEILYGLIYRSEFEAGVPSMIHFRMETITGAGTTIDTINLPTASVSGATFKGVSSVTFAGYSVPGNFQKQYWDLAVYLGDCYASCSFDPTDKIAMNVHLVTLGGNSRWETLTFHDLQSENWCLVTEDAELEGVQFTYSDAARENEAMFFFLGDIVYVQIGLWYSEPLSDPSARAKVTQVTTQANGHTLYLLNEPDAHLAMDTCSGYVCYHFTLSNKLFDAPELIALKTKLWVKSATRGEDSAVDAETETTTYATLGGTSTSGGTTATSPKGSSAMAGWKIGLITAGSGVGCAGLLAGLLLVAVKYSRHTKAVKAPSQVMLASVSSS